MACRLAGTNDELIDAGNLMIVPVPGKDIWTIWVNRSHKHTNI